MRQMMRRLRPTIELQTLRTDAGNVTFFFFLESAFISGI